MLEFEVVALEPADRIVIGERAPDFTRPLVLAEFWEDVSLTELTVDGPVPSVFDPMAGTFPTTYMWQGITDRNWGDRLQVVCGSIPDP